MTLQEAKEAIPNFNQFINYICNRCTANDWFCTNYCHDLIKAERIPFEKLQQAYARHDGDIRNVMRYIRNYKF